jgi:hypothetical protein
LPAQGGDLYPYQTIGLPSFPASSKRKDPRYSWFVEHHGTRCWEIDAMDPRDLREEWPIEFSSWPSGLARKAVGSSDVQRRFAMRC